MEERWTGRKEEAWVWRGLGGLASDAFIIDQLGKGYHAHCWLEQSLWRLVHTFEHFCIFM